MKLAIGKPTPREWIKLSFQLLSLISGALLANVIFQLVLFAYEFIVMLLSISDTSHIIHKPSVHTVGIVIATVAAVTAAILACIAGGRLGNKAGESYVDGNKIGMISNALMLVVLCAITALTSVLFMVT